MAVKAEAVERERVPGAERVTVTDITFDNSYAEGGEKVTPADLGSLKVVEKAVCNVKVGSEAEADPVVGAWYDPDKELLHLLNGKTSKEIAGTKDMSKVVVRVTAFGY